MSMSCLSRGKKNTPVLPYSPSSSFPAAWKKRLLSSYQLRRVCNLKCVNSCFSSRKCSCGFFQHFLLFQISNVRSFFKSSPCVFKIKTNCQRQDIFICANPIPLLLNSTGLIQKHIPNNTILHFFQTTFWKIITSNLHCIPSLLCYCWKLPSKI